MRWLVFALIACAVTTPAGPVGAPVDLAAALRGTPPDPLLAEAAPTHRKAVPFGPGGAGEAELAWSVVEGKAGAYVTEVALAVTRPADGVQIDAPVVVPALDVPQDNPLGAVAVVVTWRRSGACGGETGTLTYRVDAGGGFGVM